VALVGCRTNNRIGAGASSRLTSVDLRALVAVVAGRAVILGRIGADPGSRVTGADIVALVGCRAHDRVCTSASTRLASVRLGALVAVVARSAVSFGGIGADPVDRVAGTDVVALV